MHSETILCESAITLLYNGVSHYESAARFREIWLAILKDTMNDETYCLILR